MPSIYTAFLEHQAMLRRIVAKYRSNPADIDEIVQDVFVKGFEYERKTQVDKPDHFLKMIAKNLAISQAERKGNQCHVGMDDIGDELLAQRLKTPSQEDAFESQQIVTVLAVLLESMPSELKEAFILRRIDGLSYKEIARRVGVSVSTIEKRVTKALLCVHSGLRAKGLDPADLGGVPQHTSRVVTATLQRSARPNSPPDYSG